MKLFPFQTKAVVQGLRAIEDDDNILISSPTGSGKTLMQLSLYDQLEKTYGRSVGIVTSRREIITGFLAKANQMGMNLEEKVWTPVRFWNALKRKAAKMPQVLIVDEAHHAIADTYSRLVEATSFEGDPVRVVGFTATPMRGVEHENPEWKSLFQRLYEAITITEAIRDKRLTNFYIIKDLVGSLGETEYETTKKQNEAAQTSIMEKIEYIFNKVSSLDRSRPTVFITPTTAAAVKVATYFSSRGIPVKEILGTTPEDSRDRLLKDLAKNKVWISSVNVMTEGVDVPEISRVVNLRPSVSPIPYVQGLGRGLRPIYQPKDDGQWLPNFDLKSNCEFADFTNNMNRFEDKLKNVLGISFVEGPHVYVPDLNFKAHENERMQVTGDYISFRWRRVQPEPVFVYYKGKELMAQAGATVENWGVKLFGDDDISTTYALRGGLWRERGATLHPLDYELSVGNNPNLILQLASKLSKGFAQIGEGPIRLSQLLAYTLLRQLESQTEDGVPPEHGDAFQTARRFIKNLPTPHKVRELE